MTTTALVPALLPCAINGRPYLIEPTYERTTLDVIRAQSDAGEAPGEHSLSPYGLWRRSRETFHHGAGQRFADGKTSDEARYRSSKGIDPWTEGQASLLNETALRRASSNTNLACILVGTNYGRVYIADGDDVLFLTGGPGNLMTDNQASLEVNTTGWAAGANTTIARSTASWFVGTASLSLTATGAGDISANTPTGTSGIRVAPLVPMRLYISHAAAVTTRNSEAYIDWYDSTGALLSTSTAWTGISDTTSWSTTNSGANWIVSPASAATASVRYVIKSAAGGEVHYIDRIIFFFGTSTPANVTWASADIQAGEAAQSVESITSDGYHVWAALGSSGIHRTTAGASSSTANVPAGTFDRVSYCAPYLLAANDNVLYEITSPITAPAASVLRTHQNTTFVWTVLASGRNCLYVAGNSGGNAEIYRVGIDATGALGALVPATQLPDGETIHSLVHYAGAVVLGTGKGVRVGVADSQGNIDYGPLIPTPEPVRCLEPQDRFVWFGWTDYDISSTGLGRIDLGAFTENLVPAWASDIMAVPVPPATTVQGDVTGVCTITPFDFSTNAPLAQRFFAVSGVGFFGENIALMFGTGGAASEPVKVASGILETGTVRYATSERKNVRLLDIRHHALDGIVSAEAKYDDVSYASVGSSTTPGSSGPTSPLTVDQTGETSEVRLTLTRGSAMTGARTLVGNVTLNSTTLTVTSGTLTSADEGMPVDAASNSVNNVFESGTRILTVTNSTTAVLNRVSRATATGVTVVLGSAIRGPELVRWTTKALPLPKAPETFTVTIHMKSSVVTTAGDGGGYPMDVPTEVAAIKALEQARTVVDFQLGQDTFSVYVLKSQFQGEFWEGPRRRFSEGKMQVVLQSVAE